MKCDRVNTDVSIIEWDQYCREVYEDFQELKDHYPFSSLIIPPVNGKLLLEMRVIAATRELVDLLQAYENDFLGQYSRELHLIIPFDYK